MDLATINSKAATRMKERLEKGEPEETPEIPAEVPEELPAVEPEEEAKEVEETEGEEEAEQPELSERERALLKEINRLKKERREDVRVELGEITPTVEEKVEEQAAITPAEARLFTSWRQEELESLLEKYPQYKTDPKLWEQFTKEYSERVPELIWAKRNKVPVTRALFKERLMRVHRSLQDGTDRARDEGKKELLKTQSAAAVMGAGSAKSSTPSKKAAPKKSFFPRKTGGLDSWLTKK